MRALMKTKPGVGNFAVCEIPEPAIQRPDDVLIRVLAAGICGTDVHIYHDRFKSYPPVVLGHEFSGVVTAVGDKVRAFRPGDRIVCEPHTCFCGKCEQCRAGRIQLCEHKRSPGWGINGAFTDYLIVPELFLHHVPDCIPDDVAALAEPMAIVVHEVLERGRVEPQDTVAVVGAGPIGILAAVAAKAGGAARTILLGRSSAEKMRFDAAHELGVDHIINTDRIDAAEAVRALTGGRGADLVVEASGGESGINTAIDVVKKCGRMSVIGLPSAEFSSIRWSNMVRKALDVAFNMSSSVSSWERAISMMANLPYDLSAIISHRASIEDWESIFKKIASGDTIKVMFIPDAVAKEKQNG